MAHLRLQRERAFHKQQGRCIYCRYPMWLKTPDELLPLNPRRARHFQATAEHLRARCDGGTHAGSNIVAACLYCNLHRHRRKKPSDPSDYQAHVLRRLANNRWHSRLLT
jgi:hypothetical protein